MLLRRTFVVRERGYRGVTSLFPFDSVFVINLAKRKDRWTHVSRQLERSMLFKHNPAPERVDAIDGTSIDAAALVPQGILSKDGYTRFRLPLEQKLFGMDLTPGALGCALSHRKVWQMVVERGCNCALILEDDVEFAPGFSKRFAQRWTKVPNDWEIVYLGGVDLLSSGKPPRPFIDEGIRYAYRGHRELTAYVVNSRSAQRCLELSVPMTWQIDTHICEHVKEDPKAQDDYISDPLSYVFQPSLAIQVASFGTDVQKVASSNPSLEDATRRMREFVGGQTSVR